MFGALLHVPAALVRISKRKPPTPPKSAKEEDDEAAATKLFSIHAVATKGPLKPNHMWREGLIFLRGSHENSVFEPRLITLKTEYLAVTKPEDAMLDVIYFHEMVGVVRAGMEETLFAMNFRSEDRYPDENALGREILQTLEFTDFAIITTSEGYHKGRVHVFRASTTYEMEIWSCSIARVLQNHGDAPPVNLGRMHGLRRRIRAIYVDDITQMVVAFLILLNFLVNIVEYQAPLNLVVAEVTEAIGIFFTAAFSIELVINMAGTLFVLNTPENNFWEFTRSMWNWFDTLVVVVSFVGIFLPEVPEVMIMRLLRIFRVIRLFRRVPSLRRLMKALGGSIKPMLNAFSIVVLVTCICAIMGVSFFRDPGPYTKADFGELFSNFFTSMFTMFQIMTGDDWGNICRHLMKDYETNGWPLGVALFFVTYQLVVGMVLLNVVIAVLLDEFGKAAAGEKLEKAKRNEMVVADPDSQALHCPFQNIFVELITCKDLHDLEHQIDILFSKMLRQSNELYEAEDSTHSGRLTFPRLAWAMLHMMGAAPVIFDEMDWERYVVTPGIARREGSLGHREFAFMIKQAMRRHQLRHLSGAMAAGEEAGWDPRRVKETLLTIKLVLIEDEAHRGAMDFGMQGEMQAPSRGGEEEDFSGPDGEAKVEELMGNLTESMEHLHARFSYIEASFFNKELPPPAEETRALSTVQKTRALCIQEEGAQTPAPPGLFNLPFSPNLAPQWPFGQQEESAAPKEADGGQREDARKEAGRKHASAPNTQAANGTRPLTSEEGALTSRSRPPTARDLHREGWSFFATQSNSLSRIPGVSEASGVGQGISQGILGGFAAVGNAFSFLNPVARGTSAPPLLSHRHGRPALPAPVPTPRSRSGGIEISASPGRGRRL